jgi:hypothetical protein
MPYKDPEKRRESCRRSAAIWRQRHYERAKQVQRDWYQQHKEAKKKYARLRYVKTQGAAIRKFREANRKKLAAAAAKDRQQYPEKHCARMAVREALRKGIMLRPSHCSNCGKKRKVHGHHFLGYDKEHWLSVIWLCARCHIGLHRGLLAF